MTGNTISPVRDLLAPARIAVLGGTGALGRALVGRLARCGRQVVIGTRSSAKGQDVCDDISRRRGCTPVKVDTYLGAAAAADVVILCVPFCAQRAIAEEVRVALRNKILVDTTVPLVRLGGEIVFAAEHGSAAASLQVMLGESVKVVAACHNVAAHVLESSTVQLDLDVLVCGNDEGSREVVVRLLADVGLRGVHAGPIRHSLAVEALTPVLLWINASRKTRGAGIKIIFPE